MFVVVVFLKACLNPVKVIGLRILCLDSIEEFVTTFNFLVYTQEQVAKVLGVALNRIVVRTKRMGE